MRDLWVRAGLFAEGPTDYRFLLPLLDRLLADLLAHHFPSRHALETSLGIDAEIGAGPRRASRIADAIAQHWHACTLFVVHAAPRAANGARMRSVRRTRRAGEVPRAGACSCGEVIGGLLRESGAMGRYL